MPSAKALNRLQFNVFEKSSDSSGKKKAVRRVIKAEYKGIKYEAKSFAPEAAPKEQASDYYLTLFDAKENKAYAI